MATTVPDRATCDPSMIHGGKLADRQTQDADLQGLSALYNDHPDAIIEDFDRSEYGAVLREIERRVVEWERQQTPEQAEWVARARRRSHLSTAAAAKAIVETLRS